MNKLTFPKVEYKFRLGSFLNGDYSAGMIRIADWDDLGFVLNEETHDFCGKDLKIGREDGKLFKWCPRCEVKTDEKAK